MAPCEVASPQRHPARSHCFEFGPAPWRMPFAFVLIACFHASVANAAPIRVIQEWNEVDVAINGKTARTGATVDPSSLTGVGFERLDILDFVLIRFLNGVGQTTLALTSNPPVALGLEGTVFAAYQDGVFRGLRSIDLGGNPAAQLFNTAVPQPNDGGAVIMGDTAMIYGFPISGQEDYLLVSTQFVPLPEPATVTLLGWILFATRRRHRPRR